MPPIMENFTGNKLTKGLIAKFDLSQVDFKAAKTCLRVFESLAKSVDVDFNDEHVVATIEFSKTVNVEEILDLLTVGTFKPVSIQSFDVESDTEEENNDLDFEIPKKRTFDLHTHDLSAQGKDLEKYQKDCLDWLSEEFKKIWIQSRANRPEDSSSEKNLSSQESGSEFSQIESESLDSDSNKSDDTIEEQSVSCDDEDLKVLRENCCETKTPAMAELNLKRVCIRTEDLETVDLVENFDEESLVRV